MPEVPASTEGALARAAEGERLPDAELLRLAGHAPLPDLMAAARAARDRAHGNRISYSRKVFIPLTRLCRDVCHYCTFARTPRRLDAPFLRPDEVLDVARQGADAGCHEALFTLGDRPEDRYRAAREALGELGFPSTLAYLAAMAELVFERTGLLPHLNPGLMALADLERFRRVSVSAGIMLESVSERLCGKGGPHHGSPDKHPARRLATLRAAGEAALPFTTGILVGIGETRRERVESLLAIRTLHERYGHVQEIIVQNFRAKPDTPMARAPEPSPAEHQWSIAMARLVFGAAMNVQAPPNLSPGALPALIDAGINDWGGVSPVTPDHVNPEAPWPHLARLERETNASGRELVQRLALYPAYCRDPDRWLDARFRAPVLDRIDASGLVRDTRWNAGATASPPGPGRHAPRARPDQVERILAGAAEGTPLGEAAIERLFEARGPEFARVCEAADRLRARRCGEEVSYVVTRNVNYTNVCYFKCGFCAFSKGKLAENLRGRPYDLAHEEIARRSAEAWARGATEVCMQGGIHPEYSGRTYLDICRTVRNAAPGIHLHAFSPLEVWQGAATLGLGLDAYLHRLAAAGLGSLPGTAAEVLDDEVRARLCPDKINTRQWLTVMEAAHRAGLRSTATIMFGHVDGARSWARHLLRVRALQARTGGFTEFVPLAFVHMEAPLYLKGRARRGPTFREAVLMHAVARLALDPHVTNIQTSWVKMGPEGARACLGAGANDLGGTLMNESITRAAGAGHGEEMAPERMIALIESIGRRPRQRTTLYADAPPERRRASLAAPPLAAVVRNPARRYERRRARPPLVRPGLAET